MKCFVDLQWSTDPSLGTTDLASLVCSGRVVAESNPADAAQHVVLCYPIHVAQLTPANACAEWKTFASALGIAVLHFPLSLAFRQLLVVGLSQTQNQTNFSIKRCCVTATLIVSIDTV